MSAQGLQVEMVVEQPDGCPAASVSAETDETVGSIAWSSATNGSGEVVEEFTIDADATPASDTVTPVFETGSSSRYRFARAKEPCVCRTVEARTCPVDDVRAKDGDLYITYYAPNVETIRGIIRDLQEVYSDVRLRHLVRSGDGDLSGAEVALVDCNQLTDRQQQVIETAYELGYFEHPKETNATEVANSLGISLSTFTEHLAIAQSKILEAIVHEE